MGRPPLPLGTAGKVRHYGSRKSWVATCKFRDYDGVTRTVERTGESKGATERALKEALRDRTHCDQDAKIGPETTGTPGDQGWQSPNRITAVQGKIVVVNAVRRRMA